MTTIRVFCVDGPDADAVSEWLRANGYPDAAKLHGRCTVKASTDVPATHVDLRGLPVAPFRLEVRA